jgi:hypothetical protein
MAFLDNVISVWEFEAAGGTLVDAMGANDLTNHSVTLGTGKVGNCGQFTRATPSYASHASNASLQTGNIDYFVAAWVYLDSLTTACPVAKDGAGREYYLIYVSGANYFEFAVNDGVFNGAQATGLGITTGTWYLLIGWFNSVAGTVNLKVNNGTTVTVAAAGPHGAAGSSEFQIGANSIAPGSLNWDGRIDQVIFGKKVPSADDLTLMWNGGSGVDFAGMGGGGAAAAGPRFKSPLTQSPLNNGRLVA